MAQYTCMAWGRDRENLQELCMASRNTHNFQLCYEDDNLVEEGAYILKSYGIFLGSTVKQPIFSLNIEFVFLGDRIGNLSN
jgi:hypothetical protein